MENNEKENLLEQVLSPPNNDENLANALTEYAKLIKEWLSPKHVHAKTELNQNQVNALSILRTLAVEYNILPLKKLITNFLTYMLSKGRKSSTELVDILKAQAVEGGDELGHLTKFLD